MEHIITLLQPLFSPFALQSATDTEGSEQLFAAKERILDASADVYRSQISVEAKKLGKVCIDGHAALADVVAVLCEAGKIRGLPEDELVACLKNGCAEAVKDKVESVHSRPKTTLTWMSESPAKGKANAPKTITLTDLNEHLAKLPISYLPEKVQNIIKNFAEVYNTDYWMPFAAILKNVATIIGANFLMRYGEYATPAHQWIMLVCPSGSSKSSVSKRMSKVIFEKQKELDALNLEKKEEYKERLDEWEFAKREAKRKKEAFTEKKPVRPPEEQYFANNVTIEKLIRIIGDNPSGVSWENDEIASWIHGFDKYSSNASGSEKPLALSMYEGSPLRIQRVKEETPIIIDEAWLTVFGTVQPQILPTLISRQDVDSGFLQRFLFICPAINPFKTSTMKIQDQDVTDLFTTMLRWRRRHVEDGVNEEALYLTLSPEALEVLNSYYADLVNEAFYGPAKNEETRIRAITRARRWTEQCSRLVVDLHFLESAAYGEAAPPLTVSAETVYNALHIFDCIREHNIYAWAVIGERIFGEKQTKKYTQLTDLSILPSIKNLLEKKGDEYWFTFNKKYDEETTFFDQLLKNLKQPSEERILQRHIGTILKKFGFVGRHTNMGTRYSIKIDQFEALLAKSQD